MPAFYVVKRHMLPQHSHISHL